MAGASEVSVMPEQLAIEFRDLSFQSPNFILQFLNFLFSILLLILKILMAFLPYIKVPHEALLLFLL